MNYLRSIESFFVTHSKGEASALRQAFRRFNPVIYIIVFVYVGACGSQHDKMYAADLIAVRIADSALSKAVSEKDLERTLEHYANDASILPVAEPIVTGIEAIRKEWEHIFAIPGFQSITRTSIVEVSRSRDLGYTRGTYTAKFDLADGTSTTERGKWVTVWKKQTDGSWKVAVEIYNTDEPPPDHQ